MTTIYHNPRCSKSRQTLQLLEENGITPEVILYLQTPPTKAELQHLLSMLNMSSARDLMRTKEDIYKSLNLSEETNEEALLEAMAAHPKLIERPIVVHQNNAKIGRPPESTLELF